MSDLTTQYMGYTIRYDEHDNGWYVYNKDADLMNEYVIKSLAEAKQSVDRHIQGNLPSIPVLKDTFLDGIVEGVARLDPFGEVWFSGPKGEFVVDPIQLLHDTPKNRQTMEAIHD